MTLAIRQGVVAVVVQRQQWLVIRRSQTVRAPGMICFPGGGVEPGESQQQAIVREMQEELAVSIRPRAPLWGSRTPNDVELAWWHVELLDEPAAIVPNLQEVADVQWLAPDDIEALPDLLPTNHAFLAAWRDGQFEIPGA